MPVPIPDNIRSVQPGGGRCYQIELAWGRMRRWYLKRFRSGYVRRMAELRRGSADGAPHEILDPRDLKYCCNLCTAFWELQDDPFRWRERLPFARWGLAELQLFGWPLLLMTIGLCVSGGLWRWLSLVPAVLLGLVAYFFRDPARVVPQDVNAIVAPADGTIAEVTEVDHYDFFDGPAIRIGIFLSIFNVHVNRAPRQARVVDMHYKPGEFLNAMNPESALRNEFMWIGLEEIKDPRHKLAVRAISGLIARRIVCVLKLGQTVQRGEKFGMIKLGSRTELILPKHAVAVQAFVGQKIKAGSSILARYVES
ncbi:MAG: phosphatidylserine decarboxylase [Pirellulales bacterium]|nr:phosphatidylserine decarboxylase [Pirellulales bacterium]